MLIEVYELQVCSVESFHVYVIIMWCQSLQAHIQIRVESPKSSSACLSSLPGETEEFLPHPTTSSSHLGHRWLLWFS